MNVFIEKYKKDLLDFTNMSHAVGQRNDYIQGGGGNTSVKLEDGLMAIKASGYCLSDIQLDQAYAVIDYIMLSDFYNNNQLSDFEDVEKSGSSKAKEATKVIEGIAALRPSVEAGFHSILDKHVLHSHSVYANLAACSEECIDIIIKALSGAGYTFGFVQYTDPGARLTFSIRDEIAGVKFNTGRVPNVIFLQNHGLIVHHQDYTECLRIHEEVNEKIAAVFGITSHDFPHVSVKEYEYGMFIIDAPYLEEKIRSGEYSVKELCEDALYPDQLVFLNGTLFFNDKPEKPEQDTCCADIRTGKVIFNMSKPKAQTIAETLTAVIFIRENIKISKYTLLTMGEAAKQFIANWESEKYRKSLAGKQI